MSGPGLNLQDNPMPDERPFDRQDPEHLAQSSESPLFDDDDADDDLEGEHPHRSELVNGTFATVCPGFEPSPLRFLCNQPAMRILVVFGAIVIPLAIGAFAAGSALRNLDGGWATMLLAFFCYGIGAILAFLAIVDVVLAIVGYRAAARYFKNALLTPGVVASSSPLAVVVLAPLGNGEGPRYHGLQRLDLKRLPYHSREPGTRVPCVSSFWPAPGLDRWLHFLPEPICWGPATARRWISASIASAPRISIASTNASVAGSSRAMTTS
jgi:hypothetical protein